MAKLWGTMTERLIIRINDAEPPSCSWLTLRGLQITSPEQTCSSLVDLPPHVKNLPAWIVVPSAPVLMTEVMLPGLKPAQLAKAVPYALEDALVEDIENLHFANGSYREGEPTPVAIVKHSKMQAWLTWLQQVELHMIALIPDILALPLTDKRWSLMQNKGRVLVRTDRQAGFSIELEQALTVLQAIYVATANKPVGIDCYGEVDVRVENDVRSMKLECQPTIKLNLAVMAEALLTHPTVNLLQGAYRPQLKLGASKKLWIIAAALLVTWFGLSMLGAGIELWQLKTQQQKLQQQINAVYRRIFPQAKQIVAPRARIEQALNKLQRDSHAGALFQALQSIGEAKQAYSAKLMGFDYSQNKLIVQVSAANFKELNAFVARLKQAGLQVVEDNATSSEQVIRAKLLITL